MQVGDVYKTPSGDLVVEHYNNAFDVDIMFLTTGYKRKAVKAHIIKGQVKDPMFPSVHGIGYLGNTGVSRDGGLKPAYILWRGMITRCYSPHYLNRHPTYRDCHVDPVWLCFERFEMDVLQIPGYDRWSREGAAYELDKDIRVEGNKLYSLETCSFVSKSENVKFAMRKKSNGNVS